MPTAYRSNDGLLACRLTSYTPTSHTGNVGYNKEEMINNNPEEFFEIDTLDGKEKLLEIIKKQYIAEGFPIKCKNEDEAIVILEKLLDSSTYSEQIFD